MKIYKVLVIIVFFQSQGFSQIANIRFSFEIFNSNTAEIYISTTTGEQNVAGFNGGFFFKSSETQFVSLDVSPATDLGWATAGNFTTNVGTGTYNYGSEGPYDRFLQFQLIDGNDNGTVFTTTPTMIAKVIFDSSGGTPNYGDFIFQVSSTEEPAFVVYAAGFGDSGPVVTEEPVEQELEDTSVPILIMNFYAKKFDLNASLISWSIASALTTSHFELYRSTDGIYWDNIARVVSTGAKDYSYIDDGLRMRSSENVFYYRLKVVDRDGSHFFSDIRNVKFLRTDERSISIYPNPAGNKSVLDLSALNPADGLIEVLIYDMSGKQLIKSWIANNPEENIDLSGLPDSSYNLTVRQRDNVYNARLIKAGN